MTLAEKICGERIVLKRAKPTFKLSRELYRKVKISVDSLLPWLTWALSTKSAEDEYAYLLNWCEKHWVEDKGCAYVIRHKETDEVLGMIDFFSTNQKDKSGEIGYWLSVDAVGHGYMSEAVKLLESEVFAKGYHRIVIKNDTRNQRSVNVTKNCGYHLDGVLRHNHWSEYEKRYTDSNIWSKLSDEEQPQCKICNKKEKKS